MKTIESFTEGKLQDASLSEDKIIVTKNFVVVLDGATSKTSPKLDGKAGGRFAVDTAEPLFERLPADIDVFGAVRALSGGLRAETQKHALPGTAEPPTYGLLAYSIARREIWRVGDAHFMVDGNAFMGSKEIDDITIAARAAMVDAMLQRGMAVKEILSNDVGRNFIQPLLNVQHYLANNIEARYGYGVIDGREVPEKFIEVFKVPDAKEIVFASDGYPQLFPTLAESEKNLFDLLKQDPLLYKDFKATKALAPGQVSYDDRAYIRFTP